VAVEQLHFAFSKSTTAHVMRKQLFLERLASGVSCSVISPTVCGFEEADGDDTVDFPFLINAYFVHKETGKEK